MKYRFRKPSYSRTQNSHATAINSTTTPTPSHTQMNPPPIPPRRLSFHEINKNNYESSNTLYEGDDDDDDDDDDDEEGFAPSRQQQQQQQKQHRKRRSKSWSFRNTSSTIREGSYNDNNNNNSSNSHRVVFSEGTLQGSPTNARRYLHTIFWCITSALSAVITKRLMTTYPYPFTIAAVVLTFQSIYSALTWIIPRKRSCNSSSSSSTTGSMSHSCNCFTNTSTTTHTTAPPWHALKRRHYRRLLPAVLCHGLGTILSYAAVPWGPASTLVLLRMMTSTTNITILLQPFFQRNAHAYRSRLANNNRNNPSVLSILLVVSSSTLGLYLVQSPFLQILLGMTTSITFWGRSQIRIPTRWYRGGQNVFFMTCILSLCLVVMPLMIYWEGWPSSPLHVIDNILTTASTTTTTTTTSTLTLDQGISLILLGVLYCISNEYCFSSYIMVSTSRLHVETIRRFISYMTCLVVLEEFPSFTTDDINTYDDPSTTHFYYYIMGTLLLMGSKIYTTRFLTNKGHSDNSNINNNNNRQSYPSGSTRDRTTSNDSMSTMTSLNSILRNW